MSIDPKILRRMQGEDSFLQSQTRGSRRVKLNRGQNWIVRFLPARMGPDGLWFARIAKHWLNKLPIICPRNTATDFGGDPDFDCPACQLAEELNESAEEAISLFGYKSRANPQYLTYCVVWEKEGVQQSLSEILNPYEFNHYRSTYEELKGFYLAGARKCADSVLDYEKGNDFSVNKTAKGLRLDKQDSSPIFNVDEIGEAKYADYIRKLEAAMKTPKVVIPTHEQLQVFAAKMQEAANRGGVPEDEDSPRGGRRRTNDDEAQFRRGVQRPAANVDPEDDLPYDGPPARRAVRAAAPASRSAPESDNGEEAPEEPASHRRMAPATEPEAAPPRRAAAASAARRPAPEPEAEPPRRRSAEPVNEPPRRAASAPAARRPAPEPEPEADPEPEPEADSSEPLDDTPPRRSGDRLPNTARRALEPTERRSAGRAESTGAPQGDAEDDDPLPEDDTDPVPPAGKAAAADADAPPPVARRGNQGAAIKDRLAKLPRGA